MFIERLRRLLAFEVRNFGTAICFLNHFSVIILCGSPYPSSTAGQQSEYSSTAGDARSAAALYLVLTSGYPVRGAVFNRIAAEFEYI